MTKKETLQLLNDALDRAAVSDSESTPEEHQRSSDVQYILRTVVALTEVDQLTALVSYLRPFIEALKEGLIKEIWERAKWN